MISIHALLAESDSWPRAIAPLCLYFYPRSPCGERRYRCVLGCVGYYFYPRSPCGERRLLNSSWISSIKFLSTLSLRRATGAPVDKMPSSSDFYPRSPCGERHGDGQDHRSHLRFLSTLSLRRATWQRGSRITYVEFLSTLSLRRATPSNLASLR